MQHYPSLQAANFSDSWLTIGVFDGLHTGHQSLIKTLTADARQHGAPAVLLTFDPHPSQVLGRPAPRLLTLPAERAELAFGLGLDAVITQPFTPELAATSAEDYVALLVKHLGLKKLFVGYDFALGRNRAGDVPRLAELGQKMGFDVLPQAAISFNETVVSSTRIRQLLAEGEVAEAGQFLGYPYFLSGNVIRGDGRGRTIGIPTANVEVDVRKVVPANGVYACWAWAGGKKLQAMVNIGVRPTFTEGETAARVEAHLLDFDADIYDQTLKLAFVARLRGEQKFPGIEALVAQIHADIEAGRRILSASL